MYQGPLNIEKMTAVQKRAYKAWKDQRQRCLNPNDPRYYCYGAVGIRVEYSPRELIAWYEKRFVLRTCWNRPQIGRIDHAKNYTLDNIELIECSENVKERNKRLGNPTPAIKIIQKDWVTGDVLAIYDSIREASRQTGITRAVIQKHIKNKMRRRPSFGSYFRKL